MADLTVYTRPGCPFSLRLRTRLRLARIPFESVDIHADPDAAAIVRSVNDGDELVPTVRITGGPDGEQFLSNPSFRELQEALACR